MAHFSDFFWVFPFPKHEKKERDLKAAAAAVAAAKKSRKQEEGNGDKNGGGDAQQPRERNRWVRAGGGFLFFVCRQQAVTAAVFFFFLLVCDGGKPATRANRFRRSPSPKRLSCCTYVGHLGGVEVPFYYCPGPHNRLSCWLCTLCTLPGMAREGEHHLQQPAPPEKPFFNSFR